MNKCVTILIFICLASLVSAQNNELLPVKFSEKTFDFYSVKEGAGNVSHTFHITNIGLEKARIISCETDQKWEKNIRLKWDKKNFSQFERAGIQVTLNPSGLRNHIQIALYCRLLYGTDTLHCKLMLKAYIQAIPTTREEKYNMQDGHLKFDNNTISLARMGRTEIKRDTLIFYNIWDSVMTFKAGKLPSSIRIEQLTSEVGPEEEGMLVFTFHAEAVNDWGSVLEKFTLITNDPLSHNRNGKKTFFVIAEIYDDFQLWSPEELQNAPHILTEEDEYHFGSCSSGDEVKHDFRITNTGKSPLVIHKIKTSCGCTTSKPEKERLEPGESTYIKAIFNTYNKKGAQAKEIYLITNDPDQPKTTLRIIGQIQ